MTTLFLNFRAVYCNGWPQIRVSIDNDVIEELEFDNETASIQIPLDLFEGAHELHVERLGKTNNNIKFVDGQILEDQMACLESMYIDDVELPKLFLYQGKFYHDNQVLLNTLHWGPNGTWKWNFETPIITWLVDQKNQNVDALDMLVPNLSNIDNLRQEIREFKQLWQ